METLNAAEKRQVGTRETVNGMKKEESKLSEGERGGDLSEKHRSLLPSSAKHSSSLCGNNTI